MRTHNVRVEGIDEAHARVYIDGNSVRATKLDVHMEANCVTQTEIHLNSEPDLDYESLVTYDFSPKTVKGAVDVLKVAIKKRDFVAFMGMSDLNRLMNER